MHLLELPLELVQDILSQVGLSSKWGWLFEQLLELRTVNTLFEREIVKYFSRYQLDHCASYDAHRIPDEFFLRLLQEHIGAKDRRGSYFASRMHAVVDMLVDLSKRSGKSVEREDVLRDTCEAILRSSNKESIASFAHPAHPSERRRCQEFEENDILKTSLVMAVIMRYHGALKELLKIHETMRVEGQSLLSESVKLFGRPLHQAMRLGYADIARLLVDAGAPVGTEGFEYATVEAAKAGHIEIIADVNLYMHDLIHPVVDIAGRYNHWDLVEATFEKHGADVQDEIFYKVLCSASYYGRDDMVLRIISDYGVRPRNTWAIGCRRYPLREAIRGGHLSTVQLLLENGAIGDHVESHIDVLTRYVAISGSFEVFEFLKGYYFWKPHLEYLFLPIAAGRGHHQFVEHVIQNNRQPRKRKLIEDSEYRYMDFYRYFSVIQAIVASQADMVRFLVKELDLDLNDPPTSDTYPHLEPISFAIDTGNISIVRLLISELKVKFSDRQPDVDDFDYRYRRYRSSDLDDWRQLLGLGKDFSNDYYDVPQRKVDALYDKTLYLLWEEKS